MLHDLKTTAGRDFGRLFAPGERTVLYAPVQWQSRSRTLLEMMASASTEQDYPGPLYLLLMVLAFVQGDSVWRVLHAVLFGLFGCGSFVLGAAVCCLAVLYTRGAVSYTHLASWS